MDAKFPIAMYQVSVSCIDFCLVDLRCCLAYDGFHRMIQCTRIAAHERWGGCRDEHAAVFDLSETCDASLSSYTGAGSPKSGAR